MAQEIKIRYKHKKSIKDIYKELKWRFEGVLFVITWLAVILSISFGIIFGCIYLTEDAISREEIKDVKKTTIVIKKKNGLTNEFTVNSNGELKIKTMEFKNSILLIRENGKNSLGIPIYNDIEVENVDTFYIKK